MKSITLLPADVYTVVNKTILTEIDRKNLISLYEPIIGPLAISVYLTLWRDLDKLEIMSIDYTHHHLMSILKSNLDAILKSREVLESVGLIKTYLKESEANEYVYELYSPLSANEFFLHPIFSVVLYNNIGKCEFELLRKEYESVKVDLKGYKDISKSINTTLKSVTKIETFDVNNKTSLEVIIDDCVSFEIIEKSISKGLLNKNAFDGRTKDLINSLAFLYNFDTYKMVELIRQTINMQGFIDKEELIKLTRKHYEYDNNGTLPTLVYKNQPEYLKSSMTKSEAKNKLIRQFDSLSPIEFLEAKQNGGKLTQRDRDLVDDLITKYELKPAVVNVLIDTVLKKDNNKLNRKFVETIAGQWKRLKINTALEAMDIAKKESIKSEEFKTSKKVVKKDEPSWLNKKIEKETASDEDKNELEDFLKEFR